MFSGFLFICCLVNSNHHKYLTSTYYILGTIPSALSFLTNYWVGLIIPLFRWANCSKSLTTAQLFTGEAWTHPYIVLLRKPECPLPSYSQSDLLAVWHWANNLNSLKLRYFIYKMQILSLISQNCKN